MRWWRKKLAKLVLAWGKKLYRSNRFEEALPLLEYSADRARDLEDCRIAAEALEIRGRIYHERGEKEEALACFREAITYWDRLGDSNAASAIRRLIESAPFSSYDSKPPEASSHFEEPVLIFSNHVENLSASLLRQLHDLETALPAQMQQAIRLFEQGRYADAADALHPPFENRELLVAAHLLRGLALLRATELAGALSEQHALDQMEPTVGNYLRSCYQFPKSFQELLESSLPQSPLPIEVDIAEQQEFSDLLTEEQFRYVGGLILLSRTYRDENQVGTAMSCVDEVIHVVPRDTQNDQLKGMLAVAHFDKGFLLSSQNEFEAAAESIQTAIELSPENAAFYHEMGYVNNRLARYDQAIEMFQRSIEFDDTEVKKWTAGALRGMSYAAIEKGDLELADDLCRRSLTIDPANSVALNELTYIERLRRKAEADTHE